MKIAERRSGEVVVVAPQGRFDLVGAPAAKQRIHDLARGGASRIVLDLGGVSFMDSSGLGMMIAALKTARQAGCDVRIAAPGEQVRAVLRLTRIDQILTPHDTVEAAVGSW